MAEMQQIVLTRYCDGPPVPEDFALETAPLPEPTFDPAVISDAAVALVDRFDHSRAVRLMGVRLEMTPPDAKNSEQA